MNKMSIITTIVITITVFVAIILTAVIIRNTNNVYYEKHPDEKYHIVDLLGIEVKLSDKSK